MKPKGRQRHRFPAVLRIKSRDDFRRVFHDGKVAADKTLVVHAILNSLPVDAARLASNRQLESDLSKQSGQHDSPHLHNLKRENATRLGLSISKKVGSAPQRNRWKRLIREAFRLSQQELPAGLLLVVRPRKGGFPELSAIRKSLQQLTHQLHRKLSAPARKRSNG